MTDDDMAAHAAARGLVHLTTERFSTTTTLVAWKPNKTRPGADGQPRTRRINSAVVLNKYGVEITVPLNRYTVEIIK